MEKKKDNLTIHSFIDRFLKEYKTLPCYTEEEAKKLAEAFVQDILDKVWGRKACLKE